MSTPRNDEPASQGTDDSRIYVSSIEISLVKNASKTIKSITLRKNADKLEDVQKTIHAGDLHRVEFNPPISFDPSDHVYASVSCRSRWRNIDVEIDINLRDVERMRDDDDGKLYRKKTESVEVVVTVSDVPRLAHQIDLFCTEVPPPPDLTAFLSKIENQYMAGGSFGDIYKCWYQDGPTMKEAAVKAFRFKFTADGDTESRGAKMLRRELGIWKRLDHANIVPFLGTARGFGIFGSISLVSLWMPNGSLHNFLANHDDILEVVHRLQLLHDVANGLRYLHSLRIVHGDLNCNNVLVDAEYNARLVDFGYASLVGNIPGALNYLQRTTKQPGALRWAAPEQVNPEIESIRTTESDVYSFGCVALQLLSGKVPWSEFREDMAVALCLVRGHKPRRPVSRPIDDTHWMLVQDCWSPARARPAMQTIIPIIEMFLTRSRSPESQSLRALLVSSSSPEAMETLVDKSSPAFSDMLDSSSPDGAKTLVDEASPAFAADDLSQSTSPLKPKMSKKSAREDPVRDSTTKIIEVCSRFRLLIIGNSGVGKSTLIKKVFGVDDVHVSDKSRGEARIDKELVSPTNERFVVHDSLGFEAGDRDNMKKVQDFVTNKKAEPRIEDRLHAIWLCLETPYAGGRLLEDGVEEFLRRREEFLGKVPLVVVLTKVDLLDAQIEIDSPADTKAYKSKYMHRHCITPLLAAAGNDVTYVAVSTQEEYTESLLGLLKATMDNMDKYHVSSALCVTASIIQRMKIKEKIDLSMAIVRQKYWGTLWKSTVFRGHTMKECLQLIREDILPIWNFYDPKRFLMDDRVTGILLADSLGDDGVQSTVAFATVLGSTLQDLIKRNRSYGDKALAVLFGPYTAYKVMDETYEEAKHAVETLMAYTVDLLCVLHAVFLLSSSNAVTQEMVVVALEAYKTRKKVVHQVVNSFNVTAGMRPGGCNVVLDKIEELIWRHSIPDGTIRDLRKSIQHQVGQAAPTTGSGPS